MKTKKELFNVIRELKDENATSKAIEKALTFTNELFRDIVIPFPDDVYSTWYDGISIEWGNVEVRISPQGYIEEFLIDVSEVKEEKIFKLLAVLLKE